MKNLIFLLCIIVVFASCSDDGYQEPQNQQEPVVINPYITGKDLSTSYSLHYENKWADEKFNALGYGYDITGKYAHPSSIRSQVFEAERYKPEFNYEYGVIKRSWFTHGGLGTLEGTREEITQELLLDIGLDDNKKYKNAFRKMFEDPFEDDITHVDVEYHYAIDAFASEWYRVWLYEDDLKKIKPFLSSEFKNDIQNMSASKIVEKYGTHVISSFSYGRKTQFIYRASSDYQLKERMVYASAKYFGCTPGIWMEPGPANYPDKENIYLEIIGGNSQFPNAWMIDMTNDGKTPLDYKLSSDADDSNIVLVNFQRADEWPFRKPLDPIYEFVDDAEKRLALEKAVEDYLSK